MASFQKRNAFILFSSLRLMTPNQLASLTNKSSGITKICMVELVEKELGLNFNNSSSSDHILNKSAEGDFSPYPRTDEQDTNAKVICFNKEKIRLNAIKQDRPQMIRSFEKMNQTKLSENKKKRSSRDLRGALLNKKVS